MPIPSFKRQLAAAAAAGDVNPETVMAIAQQALSGQEVKLSQHYYSRVIFRPARVVGPPVAFPIAAGTEVFAFSYGQGDDMAPAGWAANLGTVSDTNLATARETNDGEIVKIHGIACHVSSFSDAELLRALAGVTSATLRFGNKPFLHLGAVDMIPGQSHILPGQTHMLSPSSLETEGARIVAPPRLGESLSGNFLRFRNPILWTPNGAQSKLDIQLRVDYAVAGECDLLRAAAAAPVEEVQTTFTPPAATGDVLVGLTFVLVSETVGPRSLNK